MPSDFKSGERWMLIRHSQDDLYLVCKIYIFVHFYAELSSPWTCLRENFLFDPRKSFLYQNFYIWKQIVFMLPPIAEEVKFTFSGLDGNHLLMVLPKVNFSKDSFFLKRIYMDGGSWYGQRRNPLGGIG